MAYYLDNDFKLFFNKASRYLTRFWNEKKIVLIWKSKDDVQWRIQ